MKHTLTILITLLVFTSLIAQNTVVVNDSPCNGYNLTIDGVELNKIDNCAYNAQDFSPGINYTLKAEDSGIEPVFISGIDLVEIKKGLLFGFRSDLDAYKADYDGDGAVSTYDLISMQADILGLTEPIIRYHVVLDEAIPAIDPFDIQVDFSELTFTEADLQSNELNIAVFRIGDMN